ncbi:MAG: hypothetical protein K8H88_29900, partial [Sandaracinaceae bacterium]|nr:hypothetical protein [Sandaracinaceae bacterium]
IGLRDAARRGVGAWAYGALLGQEPQVRVGAGARATIPETPLRLGFASQFDLQTAPVTGERRGDGDLVVGAGALLAEAGEGSLALDLTMWIPTRPAPEGFGRVRLVPSLEAAWHPHPLLALRTRQGMLIDASETGARAWAFAVGADLVPVEWLALGLELDAALGALVGLEGALLALGGGVELRVEWLEIALGVRVALTDEARVSASPIAGVLSLRAFSR